MAAMAAVDFEDLSGTISTTSISSNPFDALLEGTGDNPYAIQEKYSFHRTARNAQQKKKLLDVKFEGFTLDSILKRLHDPTIEPGFVDPRNCLVVWARPPKHVRSLIAAIQEKLLAVAPSMWLMPSENLHLTALEITHSRTEGEIASRVAEFRRVVPQIADYAHAHRARLIKPSLSFDSAAIALSFVPAAGEALVAGRTAEDDFYTYHHLRRDLYQVCTDSGIEIGSRYIVPTSHLTVGRFITQHDFQVANSFDPKKVQELVLVIEEINSWLEDEYWPDQSGKFKHGGEWIIGQEKGLDCRMGRLWYGDGQTIEIGRGF